MFFEDFKTRADYLYGLALAMDNQKFNPQLPQTYLDAISYYDKAYQQNPDPAVLENLIMRHYNLGGYYARYGEKGSVQNAVINHYSRIIELTRRC